MISEEQWVEVARTQNRSVAQLWQHIAEIDAQRGDVEPGLVFFRDRDGDPLTLGQWAVLCDTAAPYKWVATTTVPSGVWVATIWQGMVDVFETGTGVQFETTVFSGREPLGHALEDERYVTEAEALAGHERLVRKWADAAAG